MRTRRVVCESRDNPDGLVMPTRPTDRWERTVHAAQRKLIPPRARIHVRQQQISIRASEAGAASRMPEPAELSDSSSSSAAESAEE